MKAIRQTKEEMAFRCGLKCLLYLGAVVGGTILIITFLQLFIKIEGLDTPMKNKSLAKNSRCVGLMSEVKTQKSTNPIADKSPRQKNRHDHWYQDTSISVHVTRKSKIRNKTPLNSNFHYNQKVVS